MEYILLILLKAILIVMDFIWRLYNELCNIAEIF